MPQILCFGDSNTYGTPPMQDREGHHRLVKRWPMVCAAALGPDWTLVEAGLPGRTTRYPDPEMGPHMDGLVGLFMALESHGPLDVVTLMLGTNDLKAHFDVSAQQIADNMGLLLDICLSDEMQTRHGGFEPVLICPPPVFEVGLLAEEFSGAALKSAGLAKAYAAVAAERDVMFLDAGRVIQSSRIDGIHFDAPEHAGLGAAVAALIQSEIEKT